MINTLNFSINGTDYSLPVGQIAAAVAALITISDKNNLQIGSSKNINLEPTKSVKMKPGNGSQVEFIADNTGDVTEVLLKALTSVTADGDALSDDKTIRFKFNCSEAEYNTKNAEDVDTFDIKVKTGRKDSSSDEKYCQAKLKARSWDIRCMEHGGIALQINGEDSDGFENKIKFESSRKTAIGTTKSYNSTGGDGLEFGTFNNDHASLYCGDYRFKADAPIYAVTRGTITTDATTGKTDYPTQADDFKDIISDTSPITWAEVVAAVKYLKAQGNI